MEVFIGRVLAVVKIQSLELPFSWKHPTQMTTLQQHAHSIKIKIPLQPQQFSFTHRCPLGHSYSSPM